ncbi:hypothetical protein, partial [Nocardia paucivorans]|uniref:hypothetical protein n=1 Tax=Nocardia paucivorans TaxID=114259 RepID=UPI0005933272
RAGVVAGLEREFGSAVRERVRGVVAGLVERGVVGLDERQRVLLVDEIVAESFERVGAEFGGLRGGEVGRRLGVVVGDVTRVYVEFARHRQLVWQALLDMGVLSGEEVRSRGLVEASRRRWREVTGRLTVEERGALLRWLSVGSGGVVGDLPEHAIR